MRNKGFVLVCIAMVAIGFYAPMDAIVTAEDNDERPVMEFTKIEGPLPIGGPITAERKESGYLGPSAMALGIDVGIAQTDATEENPSIATDNSGNYLVLYESETNLFDHRVAVALSNNDGDTWAVTGPWWEDFIETPGDTLPEVDFAFEQEDVSLAYGTFTTAEQDGGTVVWLDLSNEPTAGTGWSINRIDWNDNGFWGSGSADIACDDNIILSEYTDYPELEPWVMTYTMSYANLEPFPDCESVPMLMYAENEGTNVHCWWFYYNQSSNTCIDIDKPKDTIYIAFQTLGETDTDQDVILEFAHESYLGDWADGKGELGLYRVGGTGIATNPDVAAQNDYVYLVCQLNEVGATEDVVCFHSSDGGDTWDVTPIANSADDELYPRVTASGATATCVFTKNNNLYTAITQDAGATWEILEETINDVDGSVVEQYGCTHVGGSLAVWTDSRDGTYDIYADEAAALPALNIEEVSGGFGITVTVKNVGSADGVGMPWTIDLSGTVFIGSSQEGTVDVVAGAEATISSGLVFGIGSVDIAVTAGGAATTKSGFILGPLVLGIS